MTFKKDPESSKGSEVIAIDAKATSKNDLNADGLVPGSVVDFDTLMRVESMRSAEDRAKASKNLQQPMKK